MTTSMWLHHNRSEGCSTNAIDLAASHGHLDVLKFLQQHRCEGYTWRCCNWIP
ncbi:hypothetical protein JG687_00019571 [Phytophthora cactorum]|uniref:Ankyrin repeat-containing domain n=1 Tax=Phytophthora cactorum TaxID=29920 RepID=A0A8T1TKE8_9STRA|nr:hypothetical protein JG687_00019571 [Phytophthora cactorum]